MLRETPLLEGNIYHVYNRGAHKADIFLDEHDCSRFKLLLFLANSNERIHIVNLLKKYKNKGRTFISIYVEEKPGKELVDVLSYALMPNHFHLVLRQKSPQGITEYMRKISTAYSMYFNTRHNHSGTICQNKFQSKYVEEGNYLRWLFAYVALNPLDLKFHERKENHSVDPQEAMAFLSEYQHASFPDMQKRPLNRPESAILSFTALDELGEDVPNFSNLNELFAIERTQTEQIKM